MSNIAVTGMGIISPLGENLAQNLQSLRNGVCGIGHVEMLASRYAAMLPFGEVKKNNRELISQLHIPEKGITRTSLLALHACKQAIEDAGLTGNELQSYDTALIGATTVGGMCLTDELYHDANQKENGSEYLTSYDSGSVTLYLQQYYGIRGIVNTINTACSSSANAIMYGARLIKNGYAKRAIVGGSDSLAKYTINGFNALHILSDEFCRPFDEARKGLNLGEGAAFLVLEREEDIKNKKAYARLSGYANANDAFHPSSLSDNGDGPYLSMQGALKSAGLESSAIDFINAHGTGTENNDEVESRAMLRLFDIVPDFVSTKSNTGHTLGAAGAIESVYSILNVREQEIHPGLHFSNPIPSTILRPSGHYQQKKVRYVMSNSFGFGGNCTSLVFSAM